MPYFYFYTGIHHYKVEYQLINKEKRNMVTKTQRKQLKAIFRIVKPLLNPDQRKVLYNNLNEVFNVGVDLGEKRDMSVREVLIESFKPRIGRPTEMFARQPIYNFLIPAPEMLYFICKAVYRYVEGDQWMALRHQSEPFNIIRTTVDIFAPLKPVLHQ